eukprot:scaffold75697_cov51-Phaeocystis_antarctica.AAC.1
MAILTMATPTMATPTMGYTYLVERCDDRSDLGLDGSHGGPPAVELVEQRRAVGEGARRRARIGVRLEGRARGHLVRCRCGAHAVQVRCRCGGACLQLGGSVEQDGTREQVACAAADGLAEGDDVGLQVPALREEAARAALRRLDPVPAETAHDLIRDDGDAPRLGGG